jgi:sugar phosphate isomerase/epimerase
VLDTYHVHRAGTDLSELDGLPERWFHFCQLCDAPAVIPKAAEELREEVRERRLYLGEGGIDVRAVLAHVPDVIYALEIPNNVRLRTLGALAYARSCLETAKAYLDDR